LAQLVRRKVVDNLAWHETADETRTEVQTRPAFFARPSEIHLQFGSVVDKPRSDFDKVGMRGGESYGGSNARGKQFVGKDTDMLRIVLELDDVDMAVRAQHQLTLRAATHAPDVLGSKNCQGALRFVGLLKPF